MKDILKERYSQGKIFSRKDILKERCSQGKMAVTPAITRNTPPTLVYRNYQISIGLSRQ